MYSSLLCLPCHAFSHDTYSPTVSFKLVETQDEMAVMRNKVHVLEHQSQQLKEEVAATEALVNKEHVERSRVEKERDAASAEVQTLKAKVHEANEVSWCRQQEKRVLRGQNHVPSHCRTHTLCVSVFVRVRTLSLRCVWVCLSASLSLCCCVVPT